MWNLICYMIEEQNLDFSQEEIPRLFYAQCLLWRSGDGDVAEKNASSKPKNGGNFDLELAVGTL